MSWIQTKSGKKFDVLQPVAEAVDFSDIAYSLSRQCRFNGHTKRFYSVAQHCVVMSAMAGNPAVALYALLHDAAEAYVGDIPSPVKWMVPQIEVMEQNILKAVYEAVGVEPPDRVQSLRVKKWDLRMLLTERNQLMGEVPESWPVDLRSDIEEVDVILKPEVPGEYANHWLALLKSLTAGAQ